MSYDIYGEILTRGYCEVHPWIHEEYPCYVCRERERKDREAHLAQQQHNQYLQQEYEKAQIEEEVDFVAENNKMISKFFKTY